MRKTSSNLNDPRYGFAFLMLGGSRQKRRTVLERAVIIERRRDLGGRLVFRNQLATRVTP